MSNRPFFQLVPLYFLLLVLAIDVSPARAISIPEEQKIGREFVKMVRETQIIVHDPIITNLIDTVGGIILEQLPPQPFEYRFHLVQEDTFNAFAGPGANIFFNTGLLHHLDTVDELAGVMAHEIAHAANRHVSQAIDRSRIVSVTTLAGILAGVLVGSKADANLGQSIAMGSMALGQSAMLTFTRENETEADQQGLNLMLKTCFSPKGLLTGLVKIREADFQGVEGIPDYFKTHPGTKSRIAHLESLIENIQETRHTCKQNFAYDMVQNRIIGLYTDADKAEKKLGILVEKHPDNPAYRYGLALALARKSRTGQALSLLKEALRTRVFDPMILLEIGRIHLLDGNPKMAVTVLEGLEGDPVLGISATFHLASARLETGDIHRAETGFQKVRKHALKAFPRSLYHLADINARRGHTGESHYYLGAYYQETNNDKNSIIHYKKALETLADKDMIEKAEKALDVLNRPRPEKDSLGS